MSRASCPRVSLRVALACAMGMSIGCSGGAEEPHERPRASHDEPTPTTEGPRQDEAPPATAARQDVPLVRAERGLMSTVYQISVVGDDEAAAQTAMGHAFDEIERLETVLSEWQEGSEVSRVNAAAGGAPVHVGPETFAVLEAGLRISQATDGAFDLTWAALRGLYLFQRGQERVPTDAEIAERLPLVGYRDLVIDAGAQTVSLRRAGMAIGTGGIAKGYALDRAGELLIREGYPNFMIFGGGQVQLHGRRGERLWRVGIQHPRRDDYVAYFDATDGSISTSGDYEHYFIDDQGRRWHHIIDLRTGRPAADTVQVTVLAARGVDADAYSTACFVMGPARCLEVLPTLEGHPEAIIIDRDLRVHMTPGARERVTFRVPLDDGRIPL
ncbi:MAG: FAD:protein FMN transferase [Sandaracinaceae bacterium]|nr:FAD:protein FMN transferase [Sandaracinaceae bacterium]